MSLDAQSILQILTATFLLKQLLLERGRVVESFVPGSHGGGA